MGRKGFANVVNNQLCNRVGLVISNRCPVVILLDCALNHAEHLDQRPRLLNESGVVLVTHPGTVAALESG